MFLSGSLSFGLWIRSLPIALLLGCLVACSNSQFVIWELRAFGSFDFIPLIVLCSSLGSLGMLPGFGDRIGRRIFLPLPT